VISGVPLVLDRFEHARETFQDSVLVHLDIPRKITKAGKQMKNADLEQFPRTVGILFGQKMKRSRCRYPARPLWCRQQKFFGQIFGDVTRDAMNIDVPDIDDVSAAKGAPAFANPALRDESIYQNVKMGDSALLKF